MTKPEYPPDKQILLRAVDGPEGIEIYTSEHEGVSDWAQTFPAVYVKVNTHDAMVHMGPFCLGTIYEQLAAQLKGSDGKQD